MKKEYKEGFKNSFKSKKTQVFIGILAIFFLLFIFVRPPLTRSLCYHYAKQKIYSSASQSKERVCVHLDQQMPPGLFGIFAERDFENKYCQEWKEINNNYPASWNDANTDQVTQKLQDCLSTWGE